MPDGLHGPERCPKTCSVCSGNHHWLDDSCHEDGCDCDDCAAGEHPVRAYDREHGTEHRLAFFGCKHCPAWAEAEYVWALEEEAGDGYDEREQDDEPDRTCRICGGSGGGPDPALRCRACNGTGEERFYADSDDEDDR